jgi:co-chaperonin GroES (HSP10)
MSLTPLWKKVQIKIEKPKEQKVGSIVLPADPKEEKAGYAAATVVSFCPLAGTDSRSGFRYHQFVVGEKVIVNRQHIIKTNYEGKEYCFINDIFVVASNSHPSDLPLPTGAEVPEAELDSTIGALDDMYHGQESMGEQS